MSTISPGRLRYVSGVSDVLSALGTNLEVLNEEIFKFMPTYQNGSATTLIGPPVAGDHILNERWKDSYGAQYKCTAAGTPGTWRQESPAIVASAPASGTIPTGYLILDASANYAQKVHAGAYSWTPVYTTYAFTSSLTSGRLPKYNGSALADSLIRDDGTYVSVSGAINTSELAFQVTGGISLIGASTFRTSTGNLSIATGAGNGNILLSPHSTGTIIPNRPIVASVNFSGKRANLEAYGAQGGGNGGNAVLFGYASTIPAALGASASTATTFLTANAYFNAGGTDNETYYRGNASFPSWIIRQDIVGDVFNIWRAPTGTEDTEITNWTTLLSCSGSGNMGLGVTAWGTSAAKVFGIGNGTEPSSSPADMIQLYSVDLSAGNATLGIRTETAVAVDVVAASTHTLSVRINGSTYKILLST